MVLSLDQLENLVVGYDTEQSLLFLNHLLTVSRKMARNHHLERELAALGYPLPPHIVQLVAKLILTQPKDGTRAMDWSAFRELMGLIVSLDDPISFDPTWSQSDPSGFFERFLGLQIAAQRRNAIQKYGLAVALFRDIGIVNCPDPFDLRSAVENELQIPVADFISLGQIGLGLSQARCGDAKCIGTFSRELLNEAARQGMNYCSESNVEVFLERYCATPQKFRSISSRGHYRADECLYRQFEFNVLKRFPIVEVKTDHYIAPDPELNAERATYGIFYDLFESQGLAFVEKFGFAFEKLVGDLLKSIVAEDQLWSSVEFLIADDHKKKPDSKIADWIYRGKNCNILFECKSIRPSLPLLTYGSDDHIEELVGRITSALKQLAGHQDSISRGEWEYWGLVPKNPLFVLTTFGRFETANGPFIRKRVTDSLAKKGLNSAPFVVLSIEELDCVISLVERNLNLEDIVATICSEQSFAPFNKFSSYLEERAVSSFVLDKGKQLFDSITSP